MVYAGEMEGLCARTLRAPLLARPKDAAQTFSLRGSATWGDVLAEIGLEDPHRVSRGLTFWRDLIVDEDISLLVADFAPLALRAALGLRDEGWDIRIVSIGTGYTSPPSGLDRFPVFLPDFGRTTRDEGQTLAVVNAVGRDQGLEPLPRLTALYDVDLTLATGFDFLDPYRDLRPPQGRIAPLVPASAQLAGDGSGLFVYFSTAELTDPKLVAALAALPLPRRGYLPSATPEVQARLSASGMELLDQPASADEIAAYARLTLHAAPHGTVCLAALAGVPQFAVPQHLEQLYNARQAAAAGILQYGARGDGDLGERIRDAYADAALAQRARAVALDLRRNHPRDPLAALRRHLAPVLDSA